MNETIEMIGSEIHYAGQTYVPAIYLVTALLCAVLIGLLAMIVVELYVNNKWRRQLIDLGHEDAYIDVCKAKKKFVKTNSYCSHDD